MLSSSSQSALEAGLLPTSTSHPASSSSSSPASPRPSRLDWSTLAANRVHFLLKQRARTTNLAVFLLASVALISLAFNLNHSVALRRASRDGLVLRSPRLDVPPSLLSTVAPAYEELNHLVMVPGHAIWQGCDASLSTTDDDWVLQEFQKDGNHVSTYLRHIARGAEIAVQDPRALLIFSGGQTREGATLTEALSYLRIAKLGNVFQQYMSDEDRVEGQEFERVTTEDFAMDSMQNVLFSIARFKEFTGHYPTFITVVGYGMKSLRYKTLHRLAVRWPSAQFRYIGIDNAGDTEKDYLGE
ncbi:hypothetical protein JCM10212_006520, partial [Sporobolomyces blumeae]